MQAQKAFAVIVEFMVDHRYIDDFIGKTLNQSSNSLEMEPKCHRFDVCQNEENINRVFLYELYEDKLAFEEHLNSTHYLRYHDQVKEWILDKK